MLKKLVIGLLCLSLLDCNIAFAADGDAITNDELINLSASKVDSADMKKIEEYTQSIEENLETEIVCEDGTKDEISVMDVEVRKINTTYVSGAKVNTYSATAKVKTKTSSYKKNGIRADGVLTMKWSDGKGKNNKITRLKGYWVVAKGTFVSGWLYWGSDYVGPLNAAKRKEVKSDFDEKINYKSTSSTGKLRADSVARIKSPKNKKNYQLSIKVSPNIFD